MAAVAAAGLLALLWLSPGAQTPAAAELGARGAAEAHRAAPPADLAAGGANTADELGAPLGSDAERVQVELEKWRLRWAACAEDGLFLTREKLLVCLESAGSEPSYSATSEFDADGYAVLEMDLRPGEDRPRGTLTVAIGEEAMASRDGRVVRRDALDGSARLGRAELSTGRVDASARLIDLGVITLRPPYLVGTFSVRGAPPAGMRMQAMLFRKQGQPGPEQNTVNFFAEDFADEIRGATGVFGRTDIPFGSGEEQVTLLTFGEAEVWQVSLAAPILADLKAGSYYRIGGERPAGWTTDWAARRLTGTDIALDMSPATGVDLVLSLEANPGIRTVLIRETQSAAAPLRLDAAGFAQRKLTVSVGTAGISERIAGNTPRHRIAMGRTNLAPWTSFAFEAWSGEDDTGSVTLLATQFLNLTVGYREFVVR